MLMPSCLTPKKRLCLGTHLAYRSETGFIKTCLVINIQLSKFQQLLPKESWAGKQRGVQAPGKPLERGSEPLEKEEFILEVQFSNENVHLVHLMQENGISN